MGGDDARVIFDKLDALGEGQAALQADVARLKGTVATSLKRHEEEIKALFSYRREHEQRIAQIERDYVPDEDLKACQAKRDEDQREMNKKVDCVKGSMQRWAGALAAIVGLLGLVAAVWKAID